MTTFVIQVNPNDEGAEAFVIYNPVSSTCTAAEVKGWAYEGEHELHKLRVTDEDIIQVDDASEALIDPAMVTGLITELPAARRR